MHSNSPLGSIKLYLWHLLSSSLGGRVQGFERPFCQTYLEAPPVTLLRMLNNTFKSTWFLIPILAQNNFDNFEQVNLLIQFHILCRITGKLLLEVFEAFFIRLLSNWTLIQVESRACCLSQIVKGGFINDVTQIWTTFDPLHPLSCNFAHYIKMKRAGTGDRIQRTE